MPHSPAAGAEVAAEDAEVEDSVAAEEHGWEEAAGCRGPVLR